MNKRVVLSSVVVSVALEASVTIGGDLSTTPLLILLSACIFMLTFAMWIDRLAILKSPRAHRVPGGR